MPKFFAELRLFIFMTSSEKLILRAARIFPGIRTIIVTFNFTLAFLIIFSDTDALVYYMEFLAAVSTQKSFSGYDFAPRPLVSDYRIGLYFKTNSSQYSLTYFQNKAFSRYVLLVISVVMYMACSVHRGHVTAL